MMKITVLVFLALLFPHVAFAEILSFECQYEQHSSPDGMRKNGDFKFTIIYDSEDDSAYVSGNNGAEKLAVIHGTNQISFVEVTDTGNVMSTTVSKDNLQAVHSRNTTILGKLIPSQYYGKCAVR